MSGYVVGRDESQLSDRLGVLDANRDLLVTMGDAGRRHVMENFSLDRTIDRYKSLLVSRVPRSS